MCARHHAIGPLSVPQLAERLGVSRITAYNRVRRGEIPAQRVGRNYIVSSETASALVQERADQIKAAVKRVVTEYGEALELLGRE